MFWKQLPIQIAVANSKVQAQIGNRLPIRKDKLLLSSFECW